METSRPRNPAASSALLISFFALAKLGLHLATSSGYGYFRDEMYYLACADHLAAGYVDHPALSILLLWPVKHLLGTSLFALRLLPALAGAATVAVVGLIARDLGGRRLAQALAMTSALVAGEYLAVDHVFSMNGFDVLLWGLAAWVLVRIANGGGDRLWIVLGIVLGLGLANKLSVLWLGAGLAVGLLLDFFLSLLGGRERRWLASRWPWLAAGIAGLFLLPYLLWEVGNGWPTLELMHNASTQKMAAVSPLAFLHSQLDNMNPLTFPIWAGGLAWLFFAVRGRRYRLLGWIWLTVLAILLANGTSRAGYLAPAYTWLFAAGGVAAEEVLDRRALRWPGWAYLVLLLLGGAAFLPFAIPVLPVDSYLAYAKALGIEPSTEEKKEVGPLPSFYADMQGWPEIVATLAEAERHLPEGERERARVFAPDYGVAAAVDLLGPAQGLAPALSGHNNYWLWGPDGYDGSAPLIVDGGSEERLSRFCTRYEQAGAIDCGLCMPYENHRPVWICHGLKLPIAEAWPQLKHYE